MSAATANTVLGGQPIEPSITRELQALSQWVAWWSLDGKGQALRLPGGKMTNVLKAQAKPHKLPIDPRTGNLASTTDRKTWSTFDNARTAVQKWSVTGLGFVFTADDPYVGLDLDQCRDPENGVIASWASDIVRSLDSYTEISPSGTGIHIIVRAQLPDGKGKRAAFQEGHIEVYSSARYFTFTGNTIGGSPIGIRDCHNEVLSLHESLFGKRKVVKGVPPASVLVSTLDDDDLLAKAYSASNGLKFERLWKGVWEGDYPSQSEADSALCALLAFWTRNDPARIVALFRRSGLMRGKAQRGDYLTNTVEKAIEITNRTWQPQGFDSEGKPADGSKGSATPSGPEWVVPIPFSRSDLPPFPVEALDGWLRAFVEAEALATQTPADLAAMLGLSVIAAACARKVVVQVKPGHREPVNIFTVTALPSGSRKSAVFAAATAPLEEYERAETKRSAGEIAKARSAFKIKESRLHRLQDQAADPRKKARGNSVSEAEELAVEVAKLSIPVPLKCIADDSTPERLSGLLAENAGRIAVMSPEGDVFDLMAGRYSSKNASNFGVFLKGHAGDSIRVDRVGRPPQHVNAPAITIGLAVQPDVIRGLASEPGFRGRGLLARFLFAMPKSLLGHRLINPPPVPEEILANYHDDILTLLRLAPEKDPDGEVRPYVLTLTPDASAELNGFADWIEPQLAEFGTLGSMADWGGKVVGAVSRIAGLLHMAGLGQSTARWELPIARETLGRAIQIGKYLIPHARAAFAEMCLDPVAGDARRILRWIEHADRVCFTRRDAHQAMRSAFPRPEQLDPALKILVDRGFIRRQPEDSIGNAGRPASPLFQVNPLWKDEKGSSQPSKSGNSEYCEYCETQDPQPARPDEINHEIGVE